MILFIIIVHNTILILIVINFDNLCIHIITFFKSLLSKTRVFVHSEIHHMQILTIVLVRQVVTFVALLAA